MRSMKQTVERDSPLPVYSSLNRDPEYDGVCASVRLATEKKDSMGMGREYLSP